ncbi:hypothetical protein [Leucobacter triazinivorans]|uniref:Uncharacterized protein n=1 Tax=Leucobacter triazinivorans TaxID=1784719 RepID=A0A4V0Z1K6_9MICO|nr:hypothetical protein [Leucobacter triazinivorans]QBE48739.1 hypothetical protein EVS81_07770 [Leucobacter triazinivorans]
MSETQKDYHAPIKGAAKLAPRALGPFRLLLWAGVVLLALGLFWVLRGSAAGGSGVEEELLNAARMGVGGTLFGWAAPFLAGAAVVAAVGKREGDE